MDGVKFARSWKIFRGVDGEQKLKDIVMDGVKFGKLENCKIDDEMHR